LEQVSLNAPAKINLFLRVLSRRPDGFHDIESLIQAVDLYDRIVLERSDVIELNCSDKSLPVAEDNLAFSAAVMLQSRHYFPGVRINLTKNIPSGAGLGGGSSDAAFVLRGLCQLYGLKPSPDELFEIAASLGSDVPFFLTTGQAFVRGRGEVLTRVDLPLDYDIVIITPPVFLSTADVYRGLDLDLTNYGKGLLLTRKIDFSRLIRLLGQFGNDLEKVVLTRYPNLGELKRSLLGTGALYSSMTGSGSSFFGLFRKGAGSVEGFYGLKERGFSVFGCRPILLPPGSEQ